MIWLAGGLCVVVIIGALLLIRHASQLSAALRVLQSERANGLAASHNSVQQMQAMMEGLHQEYDALMDGCGAGVMILDRSGVIERSNFAARPLLNAPLLSPVGKSLLQATASGELNHLLQAARDQATPQEREIRASRPGGFACIVTILPVCGPDHSIQRFLLVADDVTELRRLETVRRDFVANVSHELRTPLASIRAMAETLQGGALSDVSVADHFLGTIVAEAQRLTRISEDLLVLSQAESRSPEKAPIDLTYLLGQVVTRFQPQAEKEGILLNSNVPSGLEVLANHDQIEQVIVNLIDNSIKYTPRGGRVTVSGEALANGIAVHVVDTGIGIMSQDQSRIFERFYRVDKARSRQSGGTGLGLAIVKHIVEAHGGVVTVDSEYNRGTTFTFTLPLR